MAKDTSQCQISATLQGKVAVVELQDAHISGDAWVTTLHDQFEKIIEKVNPPHALLNMAQVEHLSSAVLGELISISRKIRNADGQFCLAGVQPGVAEIFAITRLDQSFRIHSNPEEALKAMAS